MMYTLKPIQIFILCFMGAVLNSTAQVKFEREYRIDKHRVPKKALNFIHSTFSNTKIKWYAEESQEGKTVEAKTVFDRVKYSIEFDTLGNILDVERTVKFSSLQNEIKDKITSSLEDHFSKFKIIKTQIQWKASQATLTSLITGKQTKESYTQNYEIVLRGKQKKTHAHYEILLNEDGKVINILQIVQRNTDNLEF